MKTNYTVLFLFLFTISIFGGISLHSVFEYSTIIGYGLGTLFLTSAIFHEANKQAKQR